MNRAMRMLLIILSGTTLAWGPNAHAGGSDIAVDVFTAAPSPDADFNAAAPATADLLLNDLMELTIPNNKVAAPEFGKCKVRLVEWMRRADALKEMEFQQGKDVDPATRSDPGKVIQPNLMVKGQVSLDGNTVKWTLNVNHHPSGKKSFSISGEAPVDTMLKEMPNDMARKLLKKLCTPTGFKVTARFNDLSLAGTICDPSSPFTLKGKGVTSGILFSFTPSSETDGAFRIGGTAGGVPWNGGGKYVISQKEGKGTMKMNGSWSIKTPVGVFPGAGSIPGKLAPATSECAENK